MTKVLKIKDLEVEFTIDTKKAAKKIKALKGVNLDLFEKEIIAIVGESASGKSTIAMTIMGLLDKKAKITNGQIIFEKSNLLDKSQKEMQKIRGKKISIIFQDPFSSLNPTMKIGKQIKEAIANPTKQKVYQLLKDVGMQDAKLRYNQYPHEISGGMRQRVMIAIAIASNPKIIIADEPTTSLDSTYQQQILDLLKNINEKYGSSIIFISHDLSLIANIASKIYVMYGGKIIERGFSQKILKSPKHPFTKLLIDSAIKIDDEKSSNKIYAINLFKKDKICLFHEICPIKKGICSSIYPDDISIAKGHIVACHHYNENKSKKVLKTWLKNSSLSKI